MRLFLGPSRGDQDIEITVFFYSISLPELRSILEMWVTGERSPETLSKGDLMKLKQMKVTILGVLLSSVFTMNAEAQRGPRGPQDEAQRAAFEACLAEKGLSLPEPGVRPSKEQMEKMRPCMTGPPHGMRPHGPPPDGMRPPGPPPGDDGYESEAVSSSSGRASSGVSN